MILEERNLFPSIRDYLSSNPDEREEAIVGYLRGAPAYGLRGKLMPDVLERVMNSRSNAPVEPARGWRRRPGASPSASTPIVHSPWPVGGSAPARRSSAPPPNAAAAARIRAWPAAASPPTARSSASAPPARLSRRCSPDRHRPARPTFRSASARPWPACRPAGGPVGWPPSRAATADGPACPPPGEPSSLSFAWPHHS